MLYLMVFLTKFVLRLSKYTLEQAKKLVEHLNETFKGCKAHMIEIKELENE